MDKDQVKGKTKVATGTARQKTGQVTGNKDMESKGAAQKMEGKAQDAVGKVKDVAHDVKEKVTNR